MFNPRLRQVLREALHRHAPGADAATADHAYRHLQVALAPQGHALVQIDQGLGQRMYRKLKAGFEDIRQAHVEPLPLHVEGSEHTRRGLAQQAPPRRLQTRALTQRRSHHREIARGDAAKHVQ
jgi:hypothetical protein